MEKFMHRVWIVSAFVPILVLGTVGYLLLAPLQAFEVVLAPAKRGWMDQ